jgi:hypothetical protein
MTNVGSFMQRRPAYIGRKTKRINFSNKIISGSTPEKQSY